MTTTKASSAVATARFFRVLADPTRVMVLDLLAERPHTVSELVEATGVGQSRVSTHLACLRWCRFVSAQRVGRNVIYSLSEEGVPAVVGAGRALAEARLEHLVSCERIGPEWI